MAAACRAALQIVQSAEGDALRARLYENLRLLSTNLPLPVPIPPSAIIPLILGSEERAMAETARLLHEGFFVPAIRFPTVARGSARLRVTLSAAHTPEQIQSLAKALSEY